MEGLLDAEKIAQSQTDSQFMAKISELEKQLNLAGDKLNETLKGQAVLERELEAMGII